MAVNYPNDERDIGVSVVFSIICVVGAILFYILENTLIPMYITIPFVMILWFILFHSSRYPNGFKINDTIGHGNLTCKDYEVNISHFEKGGGRKENGLPIRVDVVNYSKDTITIAHEQVCRVRIIEKVKDNHYKGMLSVHKEVWTDAGRKEVSVDRFIEYKPDL